MPSLKPLQSVGVVILATVATYGQKPISTSICEVTENPEKFDNKIVELQGTVVSGFEVFAIRDKEERCGMLWLTYAGGGPVASVSFGPQTPHLERSPVELRKDRQFEKFQKLVDAQMYPRRRDMGCMGCNRYEVTATLTGRVDFAGERGGFGHMNAAKFQFVLASVKHVSVKDRAERYDSQLFSPTPVHLPTAFFTGTVVGPDGKAVEMAEVNVRPVSDTEPFPHDFTDWTDQKGRFKVDVPPGEYFVGVNLSTPASPHVPFAATYYPRSGSAATAQKFAVVDRQHVRVKILLGPALRPRKIPVQVVWPDGKPVVDANVWLKEVQNPFAVVGSSVSHTDGNGNFDLTGFEGIDYKVGANIYVKPFYVPHCADQQIVTASLEIKERLKFVLTREGDTCRAD